MIRVCVRVDRLGERRGWRQAEEGLETGPGETGDRHRRDWRQVEEGLQTGRGEAGDRGGAADR